MSAMNCWGADVSQSPEQEGPCRCFSSRCLFASRLGLSLSWWLACKLNSRQHFKPSLFKTSIWHRLKHWGQANENRYRALDSLLHSLQPLLQAFCLLAGESPSHQTSIQVYLIRTSSGTTSYMTNSPGGFKGLPQRATKPKQLVSGVAAPWE